MTSITATAGQSQLLVLLDWEDSITIESFANCGFPENESQLFVGLKTKALFRSKSKPQGVYYGVEVLGFGCKYLYYYKHVLFEKQIYLLQSQFGELLSRYFKFITVPKSGLQF